MTKELAEDNEISRLLWRCWPAFFSRFGRLTEVQRRTIPLILDGQNVLVCAATASGKTEAVCAPLVERYLAHRNSWRILYISPTRALVNDLYARLAGPLSQLDLRVIRRTGDHRDTITPETRLIITTPESFDSLLCRGKTARGHELANVVAVVLDEVHLLCASARGEQLRWLLNRLKLLRGYAREKGWVSECGLQVVGLSATLPDPQAVCRKFLGDDGRVVVVPGGRVIESVTCSASLPSTEEALPIYVGQLSSPEKILVFSNQRRRVDTLALLLRKSLSQMHYEVYAHHGSLDKKLREAAESALKEKNKVILVATSTLEIGIDIGDVDLVVLDGPAPDVSALLQRIGRGNRRTDKTRVMTCSGEIIEVVIHSAMLDAAASGDLGVAVVGTHYGVILQQLASYIFQSPTLYRPTNKILELLSHCAPDIDAGELLSHLLNSGEFVCDEKGVHLGPDWAERSDSGMIHSNIESSIGDTVVDEETGQSLVTGISYRSGKRLSIAGNSLEVRRWRDRKLEVKQMRGDGEVDAQWSYASRAWANRDSQPYCVRRYLEIPEYDWPILSSKEGVHVFHFGGSRRKVILEAMLAKSPGMPAGCKVSNWALHLPLRQIEGRPSTLRDFTQAEIMIQIVRDIDRIERNLGRPGVNRKLTMALRRQEVSSWLDFEKEVEHIRKARWLKVNDWEIESVLSILATITT